MISDDNYGDSARPSSRPPRIRGTKKESSVWVAEVGMQQAQVQPKRAPRNLVSPGRGLGGIGSQDTYYNSTSNQATSLLAPSAAPDQPYEPKLTVQLVLDEVYKVATEVIKHGVNSEWLVMKTTPEVLGKAMVDSILKYLDDVAVKQGVRKAPDRPDVDSWS